MKKSLGLAALILAFASTVLAQGYPARPIRMLVTYPAGGGADLVARLLAPHMSEALGQPVVVENKGGASGQIAADIVAKSPPDGYTIMLDASSYAVNPSLYGKLPYDGLDAFTPVSVVALFPNVLVVTPSFPVKSVDELIAAAKARPGTISFASSGNGSAQHLAAELFRQKAGIEMTHIPYKGGGPALNDVIGGQVPVFFGNMASTLPHVKGGRLRALAMTGATRSTALPDAPAIAQTLPGYEVYEWNAIFVPSGTPPTVLAKLADAVAKSLQAADVKERIGALGGEIPGYGPAESDRFVRAQAKLWGQVVRDAKIKVE